jgi:hypothetical protein
MPTVERALSLNPTSAQNSSDTERNRREEIKKQQSVFQKTPNRRCSSDMTVFLRGEIHNKDTHVYLSFSPPDYKQFCTVDNQVLNLTNKIW